ncbi:hypothetical protein LguiA_033291 [Lonicera macranthoides]
MPGGISLGHYLVISSFGLKATSLQVAVSVRVESMNLDSFLVDDGPIPTRLQRPDTGVASGSNSTEVREENARLRSELVIRTVDIDRLRGEHEWFKPSDDF